MDPLAAAQEAVEDIKLHELRSLSACGTRLRLCCAVSIQPRWSSGWRRMLELPPKRPQGALLGCLPRGLQGHIARDRKRFPIQIRPLFAEAYMTLARKDSEQNQ